MMEMTESTSRRGGEMSLEELPEHGTLEDEAEQDSFLRPEKKPATSQEQRKSILWKVFGQHLPRSEIVYFCQMIVVFSIVAVSLYNLTSSKGDGKLWTALLSSCLGYVLPNPSISTSNKK